MSILPPVKFNYTGIWIDSGREGAGAMMSFLAKPTNPMAMSNKVNNWKRWITPGESTEHRRSRRQVEAGVLDVWNGLHDAVKIGDRFSRMAPYHERSWRDDPKKKKLAEWVEPIGTDDLTKWKNWLPLAHYAAAFREVMFRHSLGLAFSLDRTPNERIEIINRLLIYQHDWVPEVVKQGLGWLTFARLHARVQSPATTILFCMRPYEDGHDFAKRHPLTLN